MDVLKLAVIGAISIGGAMAFTGTVRFFVRAKNWRNLLLAGWATFFAGVGAGGFLLSDASPEQLTGLDSCELSVLKDEVPASRPISRQDVREARSSCEEAKGEQRRREAQDRAIAEGMSGG